MKELDLWGKIAFYIVLFSAINWGLIGLMNLNIVGAIFGTSFLARIIYIIFGVSAGYLIYLFFIKK